MIFIHTNYNHESLCSSIISQQNSKKNKKNDFSFQIDIVPITFDELIPEVKYHKNEINTSIT